MRVTDRSGRSGGSALAAFAAWAVLAILVVGVPLGLAALIGWPLSGVHVPHGLPHDPWTLRTLAHWGVIAAWLLWAQFTAGAIIELRSALTGTQLPHRIPGARISRGAARALIAVALSASAVGVTVTAASAQPVAVAGAGIAPVHGNGTPGGASPVTGGGLNMRAPLSGQTADASQTRAQVHTTQPLDLAPTASAAARVGDSGAPVRAGRPPIGAASSTLAAASTTALKYYVVEPPGGRHHDSLWDIAQRYLGDGRRYREIFALNEGRLQPDGTQLQHASLIRPGWVLVLPADAQGPGLSEQLPSGATASAPTTQAPPVQAAPAPPAAAPAAPSQHANGTSGVNGANGSGVSSKTTVDDSLNGGAHGTDGGGAGLHGGPAVSSPPSSMPHPVASRPAVPHTEPVTEHSGDGSVLHSIADVLPYVALIGSPILAAALLAALTAAARRRRRDHPYEPVAAAPDPAIAEVERTIRAAASDDAVQLVDRALRVLREACETEGRIPPAVRHARIDQDALHLALDADDAHAPAPWIAAVDGSHWKYDRDAPGPKAPPEERRAVPYPLLLPIGSLGDDQILVNLEASAGRCTAVTGPNRQRRAVLAAAAATLACAPWADQIRIEAVGLPSELALLAPDRLRVHPDLPAALAALEHDAAATGPHLVRLLIADGVGAQDTGHIRVLTSAADGSTAALVGTEHPWPDFTVFSVDPLGRLRLPEPPGELSAARLPDALASALGALFRAAAAPRYALPHRPADLLPPGGADLPARPPGVRASILGPVELAGVGPADAARGPLFTEALVLLLFHRAGLPAPVFARALWPRGITPAARDRMLRDMGDWLGQGPDGPRLSVAPDGVVRLSDDVRADWDEFQAAYREASRFEEAAGPALGGLGGLDPGDFGSDGLGSDTALARALALVRGELLADRPPGRYSWLGFGTQETEVPAVVADAAHRLAVQRLGRGDALGAQWAAEQGLLGAPDDERLVQIKIRGIAAQGDQERLHDAVADLKVRAWYRHGETDLQPQTSAIVSQLFERLEGSRA